jgi:CBS domain-containing protein
MAERLYVRDLMAVGVATCPPGAPIVDIARLLLEQQLEGVVVLDAEGHGAGFISRDELVQAYTRDDCRDLTAEDVMRDSIPQVPPDIPLVAAAQLMRDQGVRVVYMMHHSGGIIYPAASLSYTQLLRHLAARGDEELQDLGTAAPRKTPLETFIEKRDAARRRNANDS